MDFGANCWSTIETYLWHACEWANNNGYLGCHSNAQSISLIKDCKSSIHMHKFEQKQVQIRDAKLICYWYGMYKMVDAIS